RRTGRLAWPRWRRCCPRRRPPRPRGRACRHAPRTQPPTSAPQRQTQRFRACVLRDYLAFALLDITASTQNRAYSTRSCDMAKHWALASVIILGAFGSARAELPPLIPRDTLFGNPEKASPQLSPDGKHLAYVAPDKKDVLQVWVRTVGGKDDRMLTADK